MASIEWALSYAELDGLSARLFARLQVETVPRGRYVPLLFEKSSMWAGAAASLATLKYGASFVPLDPPHNSERLGNILRQVNVTTVLCSSRYGDLASSLMANVITVTDCTLDNQAQVELTIPVTTNSPADPAYVLFTSGSTGKPEGVVINHAALSTSTHEHGEFAAFAFNASLTRIFTMLCRSGCICVPTKCGTPNCHGLALRDRTVRY
jgi:non-ribosomal peptide synthetase component F